MTTKQQPTNQGDNDLINSQSQLAQNNEGLTQRPSYWEAVFQNTQEAIFIANDNGRYVEVNPAACALLGYSEEELLQMHVWDITPMPNLDIAKQLWQDFTFQGRQQGQYQLRHRDNTLVEADYRAVANFLPGLHLSIIRDITQQKETEMAYQALVEHSLIGLAVIQEDRFVIINNTLSNVIGLTVETLKATSVWELFSTMIHPDDQEAMVQQLQHLQTNQDIVLSGIQYRLICFDGTIRWVYVNSSHIQYQGHPALHMSVIHITERKQLEDDLRQANQQLTAEIAEREKTEEALRQQQDQLEQFFSTSLDLLCIATIDGRFLRVNQEWEQVLGYTVAELEGIEFLDLIHPDDLPATLDAIKILETGEPLLNFVNRYRAKDGRYYEMEWRSRPQGNLIYAAARNITKKREMELALKASKAYKDSILSSMDDLVFIFDRDFRYLDYYAPNKDDALLVPPEIFLGKKFSDVPLPEPAYTTISNALTHCLQTEETERVSYSLDMPNGRQWFDITVTPLTDGQGNIIGLTSVVRNVTVYKEREIQLAQLSQRLNGIIRGTNAGTWEWNIQTGDVIFNERWANLIGYTLEELAPITLQTWSDNTHPDDVTQSQALLDKHFKGELDYYECEMRMKHKNGKWIWILDRGSVVSWQEDGEPLMMMGTHQEITERKQAEQALKESELRFKTMFSEAPLGIALINSLNGRIYEVNPKFAEIAGRTQEEMSTIDWMSITHPDDVQEDLDNMSLLNAGEIEGFNMQKRYMKPDDSYVWINMTIAPIFVKDKQEPRHLCMIDDITERKQAEQALLASEKQFRMLVNTSSFPIGVADTVDEKILYWSQSAQDMFGHLPKTISEWYILAYPDPHYQQEVVDRWKPYLEQTHHSKTAVNTGEYQIVCQDGSVKVCELYVQFLPDRLVVTFNNITERKQAEQAIQTRRQQLEALHQIGLEMTAQLDLETLLHTLASHAVRLLAGSASGIKLYNPEQDVLIGSVNTKTDYPLGDITQRGVGLSGQIWEQKRSIIKNHYNSWENRIENPALDQFSAMVGAPILWGDEFLGVLLVGRVTPDNFTLDDVNMLSLLAAQAAVTIRNVRLFDDIQEAKQAAEAANQAKSAFLSHMSHELRTPLNSILGYTQLHQHDANLTERQQLGLSTIYSSGKHLLLMINDILDLSKIEAGQATLYPSDCDLPGFLQVIKEMITVQAEEKGIAFCYQFDRMLPTVINVDKTRLRQVLLNLLSNAVKFTEVGEVMLAVTRQPDPPEATGETAVTLADRSVTIRFTIKDSGIGIDPELHARIFDSFQQAHKEVSSIAGTGLGLAISQRFVRMMGSEIKVISEPEKGSQFWFDLTFPALNSPALFSKPSMASDTERITNIRLTHWRPTVLVVEDDLDARTMLTTWLTDVGFIVQHVADGKKAVSKAINWQPDLILLDLQLPELDGITAVQQMKKESDLAETIIFAMSASVYEKVRARSLSVGCQEFIPKPIDLADLWQKIVTCLPNIEWATFATDEGRSTDGTRPLPPTPLDLPPENAARLRTAVSQGDIRNIKIEIEALVELGPAYQSAVERLSKLVKKYQLKQLHDLLAAEDDEKLDAPK